MTDLLELLKKTDICKSYTEFDQGLKSLPVVEYTPQVDEFIERQGFLSFILPDVFGKIAQEGSLRVVLPDNREEVRTLLFSGDFPLIGQIAQSDRLDGAVAYFENVRDRYLYELWKMKGVAHSSPKHIRALNDVETQGAFLSLNQRVICKQELSQFGNYKFLVR